MRYDDCDHVGQTVYSHRTFSNGSTHFCVQCIDCGRAIKSKKHDYRLWIKKCEVPVNTTIYAFDKVLQNAKNNS